MPGGFQDDAQVIVWWTNAYKLVGDEIRQSIRDTNEPDPTSSNLLQDVENAIGIYQWQLRAFVQATPTDRNTGWDLNDNKAVDLPDRVPEGAGARDRDRAGGARGEIGLHAAGGVRTFRP